MLALQVAYEAEAARLFSEPNLSIAEQRRRNDDLFSRATAGGPAMFKVEDRWLSVLGRHVRCRLNIPTGQELLPVLVYFHGGGWVFSSVDTHDRIARDYAFRSGVAVVSVDYALSPEAKFPRALEECAAVVESLAILAVSWGFDGSRIVVGGDSAGANLALTTALLLRERRGPKLRGVLAVYPVCDADFETPSYREFGAGFSRLTTQRMQFYWDCYAPTEIDRLHPLAAPLRADLSGLPPVLLQVAELDVLRSEGEALGERLVKAGVSVEQQLFNGLIHGFLRVTGSVSAAERSVKNTCRWLKDTLA